MGIRACARLADCHIHTVLSVLETVGPKCAALHDRLVQNVSTAALQIDELWQFVGKKQASTVAGDPEGGDFYTFLALATREKLIVSHYTGKRDAVGTDCFVDDVAKRVTGRVQITTDGWNAYPDAIRRYLLGRLDYAVMQKNFATPLGQKEASRRYSPAPMIGITIRTIAERHDATGFVPVTLNAPTCPCAISTSDSRALDWAGRVNWKTIATR